MNHRIHVPGIPRHIPILQPRSSTTNQRVLNQILTQLLQRSHIRHPKLRRLIINLSSQLNTTGRTAGGQILLFHQWKVVKITLETRANTALLSVA
jgi:hypothetical protein